MEKENFERLQEIKVEIEDLVNEAKHLLPGASSITDRAESYWIPQILTSLEKNGGGFLGGSGVTMQDTLNELEEYEL